MNQAALNIGTWYSHSIMKISSFLLKLGAFLDKLINGLFPAKSLNQAPIEFFVLIVAGQKLSLVLICCRFLPESGSVLSSSFRAIIALKYAPTFKNYMRT